MKRIQAWRSARLPIYEASLKRIVLEARDGVPGERKANLFFTSQVKEAIASADVVFICVNTPVKSTGAGAGGAIDLAFVELAARAIAEAAVKDMVVVEKSTVPCKTADTIRDILFTNGRADVHFDVLSNPEFLSEGTAVANLLDPDRVLIGSLKDESSLDAAKSLADLYAHWVPRERIITINIWSSELAKIAANAFLAQRISSINSLSAVCESINASIEEVSYAVGLDTRIGPQMLKSSVGFGGSCFRKDVLSLVYLADSLNLPQVAAYWKAVIDINEWQKDRFINNITSRLYNTLSQKKVALFGFAYKTNTNDTRDSAAISIANRLIGEQAQVNIYDPYVAEEQIWQELYMSNDNEQVKNHVRIFKDPHLACEGAHAIVIATDWDEFRIAPGTVNNGTKSDHGLGPQSPNAELNGHQNGTSRPEDASPKVSNGGAEHHSIAKPRLNWIHLAKIMLRPMFVFDGRNIVDAAQLEELGFRVHCIGNARTAAR